MNQRPFDDRNPIPLARPWIDDAEVQAAAEVVRSGWLCQGARTEQFEAEMAARVGAKHGIAVSSGSTALLVGLEALGVGPGDEVIVPDMTFISTATCALRLGAKAVLCDITATDYNLDPERVERLVTPRTKAILPVHYAGQLADMEPLLDIARRHRLAILEDAAEAHLARYRGGRYAGTIGEIGIFSFTPTKLITTGEGGMVVTDDDALAHKCRLIRNFGDAGKFRWQSLGFNYRLNEMASALGVCQLAKLDHILAERRRKAKRYDVAFAGSELVAAPWLRGPEDSNYQLYTVLLAVDRLTLDRDGVIAELARAGVSARLYYPALHRHGVLAGSGPFDDADFPCALDFERRALSLPIYTALTDAEQDRVVEVLLDALERHRR